MCRTGKWYINVQLTLKQMRMVVQELALSQTRSSHRSSILPDVWVGNQLQSWQLCSIFYKLGTFQSC